MKNLKKVLCIYGSGGMGREIADMTKRQQNWRDIVFVVDEKISDSVDCVKVYSFDEVETNFRKEDIEFIIAMGEPSVRERIHMKLSDNAYCLATIKNDSLYISSSSSINSGSIIHYGTVMTVNVHIGKSCLINKNVVIGHDVTIGDFSVLSPTVSIGGNVIIGKSCFVGSGAVIRNGITIGANSIIGMGSVVIKDIEPNSVVVGNPATLLRYNEDKKVF